ncbi:MAG: CRISPR system precrRNA processing endoribonuclease RAMP protein Cas6 [Microcoleus sp.]|uniref:CRISPR system precrRNA processing endoribonuclease RAMP protein Cas6 n=1 Tax=Microcoleus sp. TaxID=44472 RepID=UPI003C74CCCE
MTFTKDSEQEFAGLSLVLKPAAASTRSVPLIEWLPAFEHPLIWMATAPRGGVLKVMAVLQQPEFYPELMQAICLQISRNKAVIWQEKTCEVAGVEVDSSSLHVLQIPLRAQEVLPPTLGRAVHAKFFEWIGNANPALTEEVHQQAHFPGALVAVPGKSPQHKYLRLALLRSELLAALLWGLSQDIGKDIALTGVVCRLEDCVEIVQASSYEMLAESPGQKSIALEFLSPTSFKQIKVIQPFPLPELVFGSLLRRWNAFAPSALQFPAVEWSAVTSSFEVQTRALKMKAGAEIGAVGWVKYEFPDAEQAKIAAVLARFAAFSGVGRKVGMGMGQVKLKEK